MPLLRDELPQTKTYWERILAMRSTTTSRPAEPRCPTCHGFEHVRHDVPLGDPEFGRLFPCPTCAAKDSPRQVAARRARSNLNESEMGFSLAFVYEKPGRRRARQSALAVLERKGWLTLWGSYGCGKSYLGCALVNEGIARGLESVYWLMPLFLEELKKAFEPDAGPGASRLYDQALAADVLVVDEFEKIHSTEWAFNRLRLLFLQRYREAPRSATIWITNLEPSLGQGAAQGLPELDAMFSRMSEYPIVHMHDGDIRPALGRKRDADSA